MARNMLPVKDWQERISENFSVNDVVGGSLLGLFDVEELAGRQLSEKYVGYRHLSDASQGFVLDTLRQVSEKHIIVAVKIEPHFQFLFIDFVMLFRRLRAAHVLSLNGYLGAAFALLRDIKDRAILVSAYRQEMLTYEDIMGISKDDPPKATQQELYNLRRKKRQRVEKETVQEFVGPKSGLSPDDIGELRVWSDLFDREMHGSFLSVARAATRWLKGDGKFALVDFNDEGMDALFMNRFCETSWMVHRLLPLLQIDAAGFGDTWARKWEILDESFWQNQMGLAELNKKIGEAFVRFIDRKFSFDAKTRLRN